MTSMFGAKSSPFTALFIKNLNAEHFRSKYPEAVNSVVNNFYMDDYLDSTQELGEARTRIAQVIEINQRAN